MLNMSNFNDSNQSSNNSGLTSLNLKKGMSLDLTKHTNLKKIRLGLGWQANSDNKNYGFDLDASALLLNSRGVVDDNQDVIYYNQEDTGRGVITLGDNLFGSHQNVGEKDDETILVDLDNIPQGKDSVLFIVTIHDAIARKQNFGQVNNAYIKVIDDETNQELARYQLNEKFSLQIACEIAKLVRTDKGWDFVAIGNGLTKDFEHILISYGVS